MVPKKFEQWVRLQILEDKRDEGTCVRISVCHLSSGRKSLGDVDSVSIPKEGNERTEDFIQETISKLWMSAQHDADGLTGVQSYAFVCFREENPTEQSSRFVARFRSEETEDEGMDASATEPANKSGLLSQLMRHNESLMKVSTIGTQQIINSLVRQNMAQAEALERMSSKHMETVKVVEELHDKKQERDLERMEKEHALSTKVELMDSLKPLVPIIASRITGVPLLGAGKKSEGIKRLLESIKPEQIEALQAILSPEQIALLTQMMMETQSEENGVTNDTTN